jgi:hypothetical protein
MMTRDLPIQWINRFVVTATVAALTVALAKEGATQQCVAINGRVLSAQEVLDLQMYCGSIQCGEYVVEGDFWLNLWTGQGGRISEACSGETRSYSGGNMVGECFSDPATGCCVCPGQGVSC